ncbi:hypothetical protein HK104_007519 [Borealophlyctis nickersoniae]|nr:hypothetical protein HK104_007519 [Borealophlyctis nickersoniae]
MMVHHREHKRKLDELAGSPVLNAMKLDIASVAPAEGELQRRGSASRSLKTSARKQGKGPSPGGERGQCESDPRMKLEHGQPISTSSSLAASSSTQKLFHRTADQLASHGCCASPRPLLHPACTLQPPAMYRHHRESACSFRPSSSLDHNPLLFAVSANTLSRESEDYHRQEPMYSSYTPSTTYPHRSSNNPYIPRAEYPLMHPSYASSAQYAEYPPFSPASSSSFSDRKIASSYVATSTSPDRPYMTQHHDVPASPPSTDTDGVNADMCSPQSPAHHFQHAGRTVSPLKLDVSDLVASSAAGGAGVMGHVQMAAHPMRR